MSPARLVHVMFFAGGLILFAVLAKSVDWVWGYFAKPPEIYVDTIGLGVAACVTFFAWRHPMVFSTASEVAVELHKVTWPTAQETKWATIVVIVAVVVGAIILSTYDLLWSWLTGLVYG